MTAEFINNVIIDDCLLIVKFPEHFSHVEFELYNNVEKDKFMMYAICYGRDSFECIDYWFKDHGSQVCLEIETLEKVFKHIKDVCNKMKEQ